MRSRLGIATVVAAIVAVIAPQADGQIIPALRQAMTPPRPKPPRRPVKPPAEAPQTEAQRRESDDRWLRYQYADARRRSAELAGKPGQGLGLGLHAPPSPRDWTWDDAAAIAARFGAAVRRMDEESARFYEALTVNAAPTAFTGPPEERFRQLIEFTRDCRNRAELMFIYHTKLHEAAYDAARFHPAAIEVYEWLADYYEAKAGQMTFEETIRDMAEQARNYRRKADLLRATPVVLPAEYEKLGELLQENVWFLEETMKGMRVEQSLATGTGRTLARYAESFAGYREHFQAWREQVLPNLSGGPSPH